MINEATTRKNLINKYLAAAGRPYQLLPSYNIKKKTIVRRDQTEVPFTQLHPEGILGIFPLKYISDIIKLTEKIIA